MEQTDNYTITIRSKDANGNETVEKIALPMDASNVSGYMPNTKYVYLAIIEPKPTKQIIEELERWIDKHSDPTVAGIKLPTEDNPYPQNNSGALR